VQWNARENSLWWTDIQNCRLHRYDPADGALRSFATPERLCSFAFAAGGGLIAAFETGVALYDPQSVARQWLYRHKPNTDPVRSNDGRCDRSGRFWFGTMTEPDGEPALGKLFRLDRRGTVSVQAEKLGIVNALCVSPNGKYLYFADSKERTIFVNDLDEETGQLTNRRIFARTPDGVRPDGATIDTEGCIWNAHWDGECIVRYAPDGHVVEAFELPVSRPTCLAFGGPTMNILFVTTACDGLDGSAIMKQPMAGNVFVFETDATGLPDAEFVFEGTR
jgi:L-arabinonolactonase